MIRSRVEQARKNQIKRFKGIKIFTNGEMSPSEIKTFCRISKQALELLKKAISKLSLSARSYFKTIKIAQTITDLSIKEVIESSAIAEALQYRSRDD